LICEGGATTYDATGQCVAAIAIPTDIMQIIAQTADHHAIPLLLTSTGTNYATAGAIKELSAFDPDTHHADTALSVSQQHAITRIIVAEAHHVYALEAAIAHLPLRIAKHFNRAGLLEDAVITAPAATKEAALLAWCRQLGLDWHDVLAIGDAEADLAMVQAARIGVAGQRPCYRQGCRQLGTTVSRSRSGG
jgi:hydroxymethylpyrimidine pyrophosphatase-like HAD family hydrolase